MLLEFQTELYPTNPVSPNRPKSAQISPNNTNTHQHNRNNQKNQTKQPQLGLAVWWSGAMSIFSQLATSLGRAGQVGGWVLGGMAVTAGTVFWYKERQQRDVVQDLKRQLECSQRDGDGRDGRDGSGGVGGGRDGRDGRDGNGGGGGGW